MEPVPSGMEVRKKSPIAFVGTHRASAFELEAVLKIPHPVVSSNLSRMLELPEGRKISSHI
jgi:hypothetical protein